MKPSKLISLIKKALLIALLIAATARGIVVVAILDIQGPLDIICLVIAHIVFAIAVLVLVMLVCEWFERIVKRADQEWEEANKHKLK